MNETMPNYNVLALLWLIGIPAGLALRYAWWGMKQNPDIVTLRFWMHQRKSANVVSLVLGLVTTFFWAEGSLYRISGLEKLGLGLTYGLTPIVSTAVAAFAHYILAAGKRRAAKAAGGPVEGEEP